MLPTELAGVAGDVRKKADGTLDLAGIPAADNLLLGALFQAASHEISDFGTLAAVYFRTTGRIDQSSLPTPSQTLSPDSPIQVVALDGTDDRVPVVVRVEPADRFRPANLISLLPYAGYRLRPDTEYAVVITDGLIDTDGAPLAPAPLIDRLDQPYEAGHARSEAHWLALQAQRDAARDVLDRTVLDDFNDLYPALDRFDRPRWDRRILLRPGGDWFMWQFTFEGDIDGVEDGVDINVMGASRR